MTTETTQVGAGESSPAPDGSAMIPDELIDGYINHLHWSKHATETEVTLVVCNIRSFAVWLRTHMHTPNAPAEARASRRLGPDVGTGGQP